MATENGYLKKLRERAKKSRVRTKHQFIGLEIGRKLDDKEHRALYMKLAKEGNPAKLEWLAAEVASRTGVKKKGAYFMKVLITAEEEAKKWLKGGQKRRGRSKRKKGAKRRGQQELFK